MNLLKEGLDQKKIIRTTISKKITIDGVTEIYPVYKVALDELFYNDQNDRIATWISKYKSENGGKAPCTDNREEYNQLIEGFIVDSNPDAIKRTQANIELVDQREPGVILNDGRIIDGNRRFTCLRRLNKKNPEFKYFETVILDEDIEKSAKKIKILELSIQHGEEKKVDYNPIDKLVGIYQDLIETKLLTPEEYRASSNMEAAELKSQMEIATLMVEFLNFINAAGKYYVARDLQIYGPLDEVNKLLRKCSSTDEKETLKKICFGNIVMQPVGDMTRYIRNIKSIIGSSQYESYVEDQVGLAELVNSSLLKAEVSTDRIKEYIKSNANIADEMKESMNLHLFNIKKGETKSRPGQLLDKAISFIDDIDSNIIVKLSDDEKGQIAQKLKILNGSIKDIEKALSR